MVREVTLGGTADLVRDVRRASPTVAIQTIDLWMARLDTTSAEGATGDTLAAVRESLETLRGRLQSSPLDGRAVGSALRDLGRQTAALSGEAPGLGELARVLSAAGERLAPAPVDTTEAGVSNNEE